MPDLGEHLQHRLVGAAMRRPPQAGDAGGDAGERVGAGGSRQPHRAGRGILLVVGVEDQNAVHGARQDRVDLVVLGRHRVHHVEEVLGVAEFVARIHERLADRVFVGPGGDRRQLGDQPEGADAAVLRVVDVETVVVERRHRADHAAHHRHRVRIAPEAVVERAQLLVQHGVAEHALIETPRFRPRSAVRRSAAGRRPRGTSSVRPVARSGSRGAAARPRRRRCR